MSTIFAINNTNAYGLLSKSSFLLKKKNTNYGSYFFVLLFTGAESVPIKLVVCISTISVNIKITPE